MGVKLTGVSVTGQFQGKCPTHVSLSQLNDKLKHVGHQTDPLPGVFRRRAVVAGSEESFRLYLLDVRLKVLTRGLPRVV